MYSKDMPAHKQKQMYNVIYLSLVSNGKIGNMPMVSKRLNKLLIHPLASVHACARAHTHKTPLNYLEFHTLAL